MYIGNKDIQSKPIFLEHAKKEELDNKKKELKKACKDFESIFINEMFKEMRKASFGNGLIEKTHAHKLWEDMFYESISKEMVINGGIGLSQILYKQLERGLR